MNAPIKIGTGRGYRENLGGKIELLATVTVRPPLPSLLQHDQNSTTHRSVLKMAHTHAVSSGQHGRGTTHIQGEP
jgi:hypothetical protein